MKRLMMIFLLMSLFMGTLLVMLSNHWFPMWLGLELSTLSMMPLLSFKKKSRKIEATLKYFLVQAFSAALLLKGAILNLWLSKSWKLKQLVSPMCYYIISMALIMKLGLAPCHFWFPDVLSGMSFLNMMMMACWQKMAPMFLLLSITSYISSELLIMCSILSVLMGGWGGLKQISMRKMMAFSSMSHMGWVTCMSFFMPEATLMMFFFYLIKKTVMLLMCHKNSLYFLSSLKKSNMMPTTMMIFSISLLSLGGLPPLGGFINKMVPLFMFSFNKSNLIIPFFLIGSLLSLFFYMRMVFKTSLTLFPQNSMKTLIFRKENSKPLTFLMSFLFPLSLLGLLLLPMFFMFM